MSQEKINSLKQAQMLMQIGLLSEEVYMQYVKSTIEQYEKSKTVKKKG